MKWTGRRLARIILGAVFLILGLAGLVLPFLQGLLFLLIGIILLAPDVPLLDRVLKRLEVRFPKIAARAKQWRWWPGDRN